MATNPMQRRSRLSFFLGMLVAILICGLIIALLFVELRNVNQKLKDTQGSMKTVYVLNQNVKAGQTITDDLYSTMSVDSRLVPSNAISDLSILSNYALKDKDGNSIKTTYNNGNVSMQLKNQELHKEDSTDSYYTESNGQREYVDLVTVPLIAKVDMDKNTVITPDLLSQGTIKDDIREQEYNIVIMPIDLESGDYIDIRVMFPNGQDFIVVSKKQVTIPDIGGTPSADTLKVNLSEDETLHMSSAIVDAASMNGAKIYATKYTDAGIQEASTPNYVVREAVSRELSSDPNILDDAKRTLAERYNQVNYNDMNTYRNNALSAEGEQLTTNLQTNLGESITNSKTTRKEYLDGLTSGGTSSSSSSSSSTTNSSSSK